MRVIDMACSVPKRVAEGDPVVCENSAQGYAASR